ncbi:MAG: LOG family protein [Deltaproteobacteria bacterium]|nr:LOG family protein [Deltaproteobacteria bacterium]
MKRPPLLTEDGYLLIDQKTDPSIAEELGVSRLAGIMRLEATSDTLRGVVSDLISAGFSRDRCCLIGRSGHSQIGLDVDFGSGLPEIDTRRKRIDLPIQLTSLNPNIPDTLFAEIKAMVDSGRRLTIGRLFVPMGPPLSRAQIEEATLNNYLLLTPKSSVDEHGIITIPLENTRYLLSNTLLKAGQNGQIVLYESKEGLGLIQYSSRCGLPESLEPGDFLCGAIHISLGPYSALIERELNDPGVFHLAARLLDAVRTSGISVPRQVELYNGSDRVVATRDLRVRLRIYPADVTTTRIATRLLSGSRARKIMQEGVDFADATSIFDINICDSLFDTLSSEPTERGNYGRILTRSKVIDIQRELLENEWHESAQNRVVYEAVRGTITSGVHHGEQITPELREFVESLELVGGAQNLRKVFVCHEFPAADTLRVLKRNNVGVFIGRSLKFQEIPANGQQVHSLSVHNNIYFGQTTYETFCDLTGREGARFYLIAGDGGERHVREFHRGFWMTREGKEKIANAHTMIAMFGSHVDGTAEVLTEQIYCFFEQLSTVPEIGGCFAVCHGSGPGVMRIADDAAADQGILRIGIGIDSEKIGQRANLRPPILLNFNNSARHMRQNILDRTSLFKIYNIGGMGTFEELLIAITNLKLFQSLPAPHIFVDPFGLGENGSHLWASTLAQLKTASSLKTIGSHVVRLAPAWVPNFCHVVRGYEDVLAIIAAFARDPVSYWEKAGIPDPDLLQAFDNAIQAGVIIPPYLREAMRSVRGRSE